MLYLPLGSTNSIIFKLFFHFSLTSLVASRKSAKKWKVLYRFPDAYDGFSAYGRPPSVGLDVTKITHSHN